MFNPFQKNLKDIQENDLQNLLIVSEGWYVEYKSETPEPKKIAKTIASFANSYGGLYIIGANADKQTNRAVDFPGVDTELDIIHDSVKGNLNPFPDFDCYPVNLKNGKHIIIVAVKEGFDPPYIHNDGRIYRRQESSSDPVPETNRYSIYQLYDKSHEYKERIEKFRTTDYDSCQGEENWSYLYGYVNIKRQDKFLLDYFWEPDFHSKILDLLNKEVDINEAGIGQIKGNIVFNNITLFSENLIIRNTLNINIAYNTLTIELFKNGSMKFMLPISTIKHPRGLGQYCIDNNIDADIIKFVPIKEFYCSIMIVFIKYFRFLKAYNCTDDLEIVFEGNNIWRLCLVSEEKNILIISINILYQLLLRTI
jgi:hypothetical protein